MFPGFWRFFLVVDELLKVSWFWFFQLLSLCGFNRSPADMVSVAQSLWHSVTAVPVVPVLWRAAGVAPVTQLSTKQVLQPSAVLAAVQPPAAGFGSECHSAALQWSDTPQTHLSLSQHKSCDFTHKIRRINTVREAQRFLPCLERAVGCSAYETCTHTIRI